MASIFKRSKRKNEPYWIQYTNHLGKRKTAKGFTDKGLTEELASKLETEARLRKTGLVDADMEEFAARKMAPIGEHLAAFEASLADNTDRHVKMTMARVNRVVAGCEFSKLADLNAEKVQSYLRSLRRDENMSHRTHNHYVQAIDSFCNWCVSTFRLISNPLKGLERLNAATDARHPRRALSPEEISRLVEATRKSGKRVQNLRPELRARAYTFAYFTGLRKTEMASLTPASFHLDDDPPTVTVAAACSKHRRKDVLPLHPEMVLLLREWLKGLKPTEYLFPLLGKKKLSEMIQLDLKRAGIPYKTAEGFADFHAAGRHTYITQLLRSGASLPEAKELARHSDVKMTMRYTHIGIDDQAKAIGNLPVPKSSPKASAKAEPPGKPGQDAALQMRCISGGAKGRRVTPNGTEGGRKNGHNPLRSNGFGSSCRRLSLVGKAEGKGFEPSTGCPAPDFESDCNMLFSPEKQGSLKSGRAFGRALPGTLSSTDPDLTMVCHRWAELPAAIRAGIVAMVKATGNT
jgi:site-specific recombinase XerD